MSYAEFQQHLDELLLKCAQRITVKYSSKDACHFVAVSPQASAEILEMVQQAFSTTWPRGKHALQDAGFELKAEALRWYEKLAAEGNNFLESGNED